MKLKFQQRILGFLFNTERYGLKFSCLTLGLITYLSRDYQMFAFLTVLILVLILFFVFSDLDNRKRIFYFCLIIIMGLQFFRVCLLNNQAKQCLQKANHPVYLELKTAAPLYITKTGNQLTIFKSNDNQRYAIWLNSKQTKWIKIKGYFEPKFIEGARNPGGFDQKKYLANYNCYVSIDIESDTTQITSLQIGKSLFDRQIILQDYHNWLGKSFDPPVCDFLLSLCFGKIELLAQDLKYDFRNLGLSHLLAISGFHFELFIFPLANCLGLKKRKPIHQIILLSPLIVFYNWLSGFPIGLARASIIYIARLICWHNSINLERKNLLLMLFIIFLLVNPWLIFQFSFQLSFLASLAIYSLLPYLRRNEFLKKKKILQTLILSIFVQIVVLLFLLKNFNMWQPAVILFSGILNLPLSIIFFCGIFSFLVYGFNLTSENKLINFVFQLLNLLIKNLLHLFSRLARAEIWLALQKHYQSFLTWLVFAIIGLSLALIIVKFFLNLFLRKRSDEIRFKNHIPLFMILSLFCFILLPNKQSWKICFLDVGQGDCCLIVSADNRCIMVDGGTEYEAYRTVIPALHYFGIHKIDLAIISHVDLDHCGGILELIKLKRIKNVILPNFPDDQTIQVEELCLKNKVPYTLVNQKSNFNLNPYAIDSLLISPDLSHQIDYQDTNSSSLCFILKIEGLKLLFTGDLPNQVEQSLLIRNEFAKINLLKVAHHGSKYSTSDKFISITNPELAIISVGKNLYGHPAPELIERLLLQNVNIKRTDLNGAIMLELVDDRWQLSSYLD